MMRYSLLFIKVSVISILSIGCSTNSEVTDEVLDVDQLRVNIRDDFNRLSDALKDSDVRLSDYESFRDLALENLSNEYLYRENDKEVKLNYDRQYNHIQAIKKSTNYTDVPAHLSHLSKLTQKLRNIENYTNVVEVFDGFFAAVTDSDDLTSGEKKDLINRAVLFEGALNFAYNNAQLFDNYSHNDILADSINLKECGWWAKWGKCTAGVLGGALSGGLAGCAVSAVPTAGFGCPAGATVGAIGGALTGAATSCDGCQ